MKHKPPEAPILEQEEILREFTKMLAVVTGDGSKKRVAGNKPSWKVDEGHLPAIFSHLNKYFHGERKDKDSGAHPLVHLAWRALAIAWQDNLKITDRAELKWNQFVADMKKLPPLKL